MMAAHMKLLFSVIAVFAAIMIYEDASSYMSGSTTGVAHRSRVLPGADAVFGSIARAVGRAVARKVGRSRGKEKREKRGGDRGRRGNERGRRDSGRDRGRRGGGRRR